MAPSNIEGLEIRDGEKIGRDPREMTIAELNKLGHEAMSLRKVIRAKCLDCSGDQISEIRKCTAVKTCALWPYRMNKNPFVKHVGNVAAIEALAKAREAKRAANDAQEVEDEAA